MGVNKRGGDKKKILIIIFFYNRITLKGHVFFN